MASDEELVAAARRGDRSAFSQLYEQHYARVYRYAYFHTRSVAEAEDAAADAFVRAIEHVDGFKGTAAQFNGWVMRIARNAIIDARRRARPQVTLDDATGASTPDPSSGIVRSVAIRDALTRLNEDQRSVVVLRFVLEMSTRETAQIMGKSDGAIEQLQRRGLATMAKVL